MNVGRSRKVSEIVEQPLNFIDRRRTRKGPKVYLWIFGQNNFDARLESKRVSLSMELRFIKVSCGMMMRPMINCISGLAELGIIGTNFINVLAVAAVPSCS
jgi:hypothetical protein